MSRKCDICGKQTTFGNNVSHSNRKTRREWKPNTHKIKALVDGVVKTVKVCAKCLKAEKVQKVI